MCFTLKDKVSHMLKNRSSILMLTLVSATLGPASAQQAPSQQVTLENGLQVTAGNCTRSEQGLLCPIEFANNSAKSVTWSSAAYGNRIRVIDPEGNAYIATLNFENTATTTVAAGQVNKARFSVSNVPSSARVLPLVEYGNLEFRGVKIGGVMLQPSRPATREVKTPTPATAMLSEDGKMSATLVGCSKWTEGFKCDFIFRNKTKVISDMGFSNPYSSSEKSKVILLNGQSVDFFDSVVGDTNVTTNGSSSKYITSWPPEVSQAARLYFKTKDVPSRLSAIQLGTTLKYSTYSYIFSDITLK